MKNKWYTWSNDNVVEESYKIIKNLGECCVVFIQVDSIYKSFYKHVSTPAGYDIQFMFLCDEKKQYRLYWNRHRIKNGRIFNSDEEFRDFILPYSL